MHDKPEDSYENLERPAECMNRASCIWGAVGLALSLMGLLIEIPVFRLFALFVFAHDFGMSPIELAGAPFSLLGLACGFRGLLTERARAQATGVRRRQRLASWAITCGLVGLLWLVAVVILIMQFDGGAV
jgi:hypothetical protein